MSKENSVEQEQINDLLTLYKSGMYDELLINIDQTLLNYPRKFNMLTMKAIALRALDRFDESLTAFNRVFEINPEYGFGYALKGEILRGMGRFDEALTAINRAIEIDPEDGWADGLKGDILRGMGRFDEALTAINR